MKKKAFGPLEIFQDPQLSSGAFRMLVFLFSTVPKDAKVQHAEASYSQMQESLHLRCRSSVSHYLQELKTLGWVHRIRKNGSQPQKIYLGIPARLLGVDICHNGHTTSQGMLTTTSQKRPTTRPLQQSMKSD